MYTSNDDDGDFSSRSALYCSGISKIPLLVYIAQNKKMAHSEIRMGHLAVWGEPYGSDFN
jgi:hypothetical protein